MPSISLLLIWAFQAINAGKVQITAKKFVTASYCLGGPDQTEKIRDSIINVYVHSTIQDTKKFVLRGSTVNRTYGAAGVLGGLVGGPRAYQDQFRGFKSHRVHARRDFFLHEEID